MSAEIRMINYFEAKGRVTNLGPERTPTRAQGRRVSRRQWRRQNAGELRRRRQIRIWFEAANRVLDQEVTRLLTKLEPLPLEDPISGYMLRFLDDARAEVRRITYSDMFI